jgi:hypothetical protein
MMTTSDGLPLQILGKTMNEVGGNLEALTKRLLAKLGFGSFVRNAYETGVEIDLRAAHRATGEPIICECKAHQTPLRTKEVRAFHSEITKRRASDTRPVGFIFSISGFVGTAISWYDEFAKDAPDIQSYLKLVDGQQLLEMLVERQLTLPKAGIRQMVRERLPDYEQGLCWLCAWRILLRYCDGLIRLAILRPIR